MHMRDKLTLVGICLNLLMVGMIYSSANFVVYMASYYRNSDTPLTPVEEEILYFTPYGLRCITVIPGVWLCHHISPKLMTIVSAFFIALAHLSVALTPPSFILILTYGVVFGLAAGFCITGNLTLSFHVLPNNPGLASGMNSCFIGLGSLFFNTLGTWLVNPDNLDPSIFDPITDKSYFTKEVSDNVPFVFTTIFLVCLGLLVLCMFLIQDMAPVAPEEIEQISLKKAVSTKEFWILAVSFSITVAGPVYLVQKYKDISQYLELMDDKTLSLLGSLGALLACFCKLGFGHMNDSCGFKAVYNTMIGLIILIGIMINVGTSNAWLFGLYVCSSYTTLGGHYTILAPYCRHLYGKTTGMKAWAMLYNTIGIGSLIAFTVQVLQGGTSNYAIAFTSLSCAAVVSLLLMLFSKNEPIYHDDLTASLIEGKKNKNS